MVRVFHLFDRNTPPAAIRQLLLLRRLRPRDILVRVGTAAGPDDLPKPQAILRAPLGLPFGMELLRREIRALLRQYSAEDRRAVLHLWSEGLLGATWRQMPCVLTVMRPSKSQAVRGACKSDRLKIVAGSSFVAGAMSDNRIAGRVRVVSPVAEHIARSEPARRAARDRLGLGANDFVLVAPTQRPDGRGPYLAVWAMAIVRQITERVRLAVPGSTRAAAKAENMARRTAFEAETVLAAGADSLQACLMAADAALLVEPDGCGAAELAEVQAAGLPVVAACRGEMAELLASERTGLLVEPNRPRAISAAIWRLMNDQELAARLAEASREQAGVRHAQKWAEELGAIYVEAAG